MSSYSSLKLYMLATAHTHSCLHYICITGHLEFGVKPKQFMLRKFMCCERLNRFLPHRSIRQCEEPYLTYWYWLAPPGLGFVQYLVVSFHDVWFTLRRKINSQNNKHWYSENSSTIHEVPPHALKVRVWCAVRASKIMWLMFFKQTNSSHYAKLLPTPLFRELPNKRKSMTIQFLCKNWRIFEEESPIVQDDRFIMN